MVLTGRLARAIVEVVVLANVGKSQTYDERDQEQRQDRDDDPEGYSSASFLGHDLRASVVRAESILVSTSEISGSELTRVESPVHDLCGLSDVVQSDGVTKLVGCYPL